ncbi:MAG: ECF-type sigma factor [Chiayiivirga sp.]|jgi:RNA polymerase sigma factor (TIGR02999 family)|uniref:ECF-type sigma factor n=1 Tax=Chiayiivirga sp. TaxID=2041042 RepID=UPI0025BB216D|nr:ECF-type sigma factor [Chiayiivirga sp.]MCI1728018.1 ECF-type sigma factor [Chiayiivirga sp.]
MQDDDITQWLSAAQAGDREALDRVHGLLYRELHVLARRQLGPHKDATLNTTGLVHEAWLRLAGQKHASYDDRAHFFAYAASAMRSIVIDHTRQRLAHKRGGDWQRVTDFDHVPAELRLDADLLDLDEALRKLEAAEPRLAQLVELRYFAGLGEIEIASLQERSERSVRRDWHKARLFLLGALAADG